MHVFVWEKEAEDLCMHTSAACCSMDMIGRASRSSTSSSLLYYSFVTRACMASSSMHDFDTFTFGRLLAFQPKQNLSTIGSLTNSAANYS
jgi:hypothetical protein